MLDLWLTALGKLDPSSIVMLDVEKLRDFFRIITHKYGYVLEWLYPGQVKAVNNRCNKQLKVEVYF